MIIIKLIILYFIQIRHTDDFPSTGTRLVTIIVRDRTNTLVGGSTIVVCEAFNAVRNRNIKLVTDFKTGK